MFRKWRGYFIAKRARMVKKDGGPPPIDAFYAPIEEKRNAEINKMIKRKFNISKLDQSDQDIEKVCIFVVILINFSIS